MSQFVLLCLLHAIMVLLTLLKGCNDNNRKVAAVDPPAEYNDAYAKSPSHGSLKKVPACPRTPVAFKPGVIPPAVPPGTRVLRNPYAKTWIIVTPPRVPGGAEVMSRISWDDPMLLPTVSPPEDVALCPLTQVIDVIKDDDDDSDNENEGQDGR